MVMFLYVFGGAIQTALPPAAAGSYVNWLTPGILARFAVFGASSTAYGLHNDRASGVIDRLRSLPTARSVLAGRTLADLTRSSVILVLRLGVGILLGFRWQTGVLGLLAGIGIALAYGFACSWTMATLGPAVRNTEAIQAAVYSVVFPFTLVSSVFPRNPNHARLAAGLRRTPTHHRGRQRAARAHARARRSRARADRRRSGRARSCLDRGDPRCLRPAGRARLPP
jgi:ABC-2 type transporter